MLKIVDTNDSGKTLKLIEAAYASNNMIVCRYPERLEQIAALNGYIGVHAMSYMDFLSNRNIMSNYYIDDIDKMLTLMGCLGFSLTVEEK